MALQEEESLWVGVCWVLAELRVECSAWSGLMLFWAMMQDPGAVAMCREAPADGNSLCRPSCRGHVWFIKAGSDLQLGKGLSVLLDRPLSALDKASIETRSCCDRLVCSQLS